MKRIILLVFCFSLLTLAININTQTFPAFNDKNLKEGTYILKMVSAKGVVLKKILVGN